MCTADCLLVILAMLFPPLPVWVKRGLCSADSLINIALCMLGVFPGIIHAWYIIYTTPDAYEIGSGYRNIANEDPERDGNVSYYYVNVPPPQRRSSTTSGDAYAGRNYGTTGPARQAPAANSNDDAGPSSGEVPPTYNEAVRGDNKVQTK